MSVGAALLAVVAWLPVLPAGSGQTELHVIDVGQGDAIALRTARGRWVLVDAGRAWRGGDAGRSTVVPYLRRRGGQLVGFVLSTRAFITTPRSPAAATRTAPLSPAPRGRACAGNAFIRATRSRSMRRRSP